MTTIEMLKEAEVTGGTYRDHDLFYNTKQGFHDGEDDSEWLGAAFRTLNRLMELNEWKPYVKPVDWTKVPIDTKVICTIPSGIQKRRHFAGIVDGKPATWFDGATSWSNNAIDKYTDWHTVELAE